MSNERKTCPNCYRIYIGDGYKNACTKECYYKKAYEDMMVASGRYGSKHKVKKKKVFTLVCKRCKSDFEANTPGRKYCSFGCSSFVGLSEEEKIRKANEDWLNNKPKYVPKRKKSFAQLNREMEWKRVWDDESWARNYQMFRG